MTNRRKKVLSMNYEHTQHGRLHHIFFVVTAVMLAGAWLTQGEPAAAVLVLVVAAVFLVCAMMFGALTVRDEGQWLALRYGPLPVIRKRIPYARITDFGPDRTKIIDGWGIHYTPGRGWTYNLWGFDCVRLTLGAKVIRIGTDDVDGLARFLKDKQLAGQLAPTGSV